MPYYTQPSKTNEAQPQMPESHWNSLVDHEEDKLSGRQATLGILSTLDQPGNRNVFTMSLDTLRRQIRNTYQVDVSTKSISLYRSQYRKMKAKQMSSSPSVVTQVVDARSKVSVVAGQVQDVNEAVSQWMKKWGEDADYVRDILKGAFRL